MQHRIDTQRATGRKAQAVALLTLDADELECVATCVQIIAEERMNTEREQALLVELRAAELALVRHG